MRDAGLNFKLSITARDLGVDTAPSKRRPLSVRAARNRKARARLAQVRRLTATRVEARKLVFTGGFAQAGWDHKALGTSPSNLRKLRAALGRAADILKAGGCTTTSFACWAPDKDPAVKLPIEIVAAWLDVWGKAKKMHGLIRQAWRPMLDRLRGPHRWHKVPAPNIFALPPGGVAFR